MRVDPLVLALHNRRLALGISQRELAALSGFTQSQISEWERGFVHPQPDTIRRLAKALGIDLGNGDDEAAA